MKFITFLTALFIVAAGCTETVEQETTEPTFEHSELVATVMPVGDSDVSGSVTFTESEEGVTIQGDFEGLEPGNHGFHIHEYGDCRANDGTSAGGHFSPAGNDHGAPTDTVRHMGDLGNIEANENGSANIDYTDDTVTLEQILGRGIIIHAGEDDLQSQPSGAAGNRIACGVIGIAQN
ncbi:MAG TPA: superoxide dismutase family protein [Gracilimonas sp.]|uniref:superoxide dismutase family protein n=1 Tax=Gracilimonas sp. TaxID=1974203 RepID=UPI002DAADDD2|nr:superoxide dismutase family protein [Gracilimonas sp.]